MSGVPTGWSAPKTNWVPADAIDSTALNRIEGNTNAIETGSRTLDQGLAAPANTGTLRQIISWFAGRIRAITGAANWWDAPATTLAAASTHAGATTAVHGVGASTVESAAGAQAKVDTHAALTTAHSATPTPTASRIMMWDAASRAKVAAPAAADDIARLDTVTTHAGATTAVHGVGASTVESAAGAQAKVDVVANTVAPYRTADRWYCVGMVNSGELTTSGAMPANILRAMPLPVPMSRTLDRIAINVATASAGLLRLGIYRDSNVYPSSLVLDAGTVDTETIGVKALTISQALTPGLYWVVLVHDGTPAVTAPLHFMSLLNVLGVGSALFGNAGVGWTVSFTYAALPASFPTGATPITAVPVPAIFVRFSA